MSLDLFQRETSEHLRTLAPAQVAETGLFDSFIRGTGLYTMSGLAKTARSIDLLGSIGPIAQDAMTGGTEAQDRYFREHDETFGSAVDYWTPKPHEVGVAAEIAGSLVSTLAQFAISPGLAVGGLQLSTAEDLVKKGVDPVIAQMVGATQGAGLALGMYMPVLGRNLVQRVLTGAGANVVLGTGMRGVAAGLLHGTPAGEEYRAFDPTSMTVDMLLGAAFGSVMHLTPEGRAQSELAWKRIEEVAKSFKQSDVDALSVLRQALHMNVDSMPGKPLGPVDVDRHVQRVRAALEQVLRDEPVNVSDLAAPRFEQDESRQQENEANLRNLVQIAQDVRKEEGLARPPDVSIPDGRNLNPEQRAVELKARAQVMGNLEGQFMAYEKLPDSAGGKILNTDIARELFPDYTAARWIHSPSVHEPASTVIKELYARKLSESDPVGLNIVTFTAGGTGAGKTTALSNVPSAREIVGASQIVYDTNMASFRGAADKIDLALAHGKQVNVIYVGADPVEAFRRMLKRGMRTGRTVPLQDHIDTHVGSVDTIQKLMSQYQGNDAVQFIFLDNGALEPGKRSIIEPENAGKYLNAIDQTDLQTRLKEVLDEELKSGRINEQIYRGVAGAPAERAGEALRQAGPGGAGLHGEAGPKGGAGAGVPATEAPVLTDIVAPSGQPIGSEAPAARHGEGTLPPPRGFRGVEAAGAEGTKADPLRFEAERFVAENPDLKITMGKEADGTPIVKTARQYLDDAHAAADAARQDIGLFEAAATCLFGRA